MPSATLTRPRPIPPAPPAPEDASEPRRWPWVAFGLLCLGALIGFLAYPTYPNYDSYYSMLWGREMLGGQWPIFDTYRAPTPHPAATFVGAIVSPLGHGAERVWIALCVISFVALVAGVYRLASHAFTPLVGLVAGLLVVTRFDFPFYAARGYIDIAYMAFVVWAAVLEARSPRRGAPVLVLLAIAGMLRPEAWVMSGLYWLWISWRAGWGQRIRYAALAAVGPLVWAATDFASTGDPLWSLTYTSAFAEELGRSQAAGDLPSAMWAFLVKLAKFPVLMGGIAGFGLAALLVPRRMTMPLVLLAVGVGTFLLVGLGGFSVIDRYLLVVSMMVMVFCAVALAGWTMLREGSWPRRLWALGAVLLVAYGVGFTATRVNVGQLDRELTFRGDAHAALHAVLDDPAVQAAKRCGPITVPNHKLVPDVRWIEDLPDGAVLTRSQGLNEGGVHRRSAAGGVQIIPHERVALFRHALVERTDDPATVLPLPGFERAAVSSYYSAYVRC
jgi:hypothetical protein